MNLSNYLDSIASPEDVRKLSEKQLDGLCGELRERILHTVSKNGGHLSSNLGSVELTVALLKVFQPPKDTIVWDVGHQSYAYKLLTGRNDSFSTLRRKGGISGFPNKEESLYDPYTSGHASTSVSAALGFSTAEYLLGETERSVVAVIGDGALTGGLAYEGFNNAGRLRRSFIVILNDNDMSISRNVGSIARYLTRLRTAHGYLQAKGRIEEFVQRIPLIGKNIYRFVSGFKRMLKHLIYGTNLFENLGFEYYGPFDGHDVKRLTEVFENVKSIRRPVLLHVLTEKGRGYAPAEKNPGVFHGVSGFDIETGEVNASCKKSFSSVFGEELCALASQDKRICAITAAMAGGTGLEQFHKRFASRFFDTGIAEEHAVTFAGALASGGMLPVFAVYSTFLQRSFDQILHDAALQQDNITLAIDRCGLVGDDGETHQGIFDAAFLSNIPGMKIFSPSYYEELRWMLRASLYEYSGPSAVRYPRGCELYKPACYQECRTDYQTLYEKHGSVWIVAYGRLFSHACRAAERLQASGMSVSVLKLNVIHPLPESLYEELRDAKAVFSFEEGVLSGGVGEHLARILLEKGYGGVFRSKGFDNCFVRHGTVLELLKEAGLDEDGMIRCVENTMNGE